LYSDHRAPSIAAAITLLAPALADAQSPVSDLNGYVTLGTGYWKHGLAQTDGASLQLGIDYQHHTGLFAYARAMNVDYPGDYGYRPRDVEASVYVGYHDRRASWSWTVSVGRYLYPDTGSIYDYDERSASVGFRDRVFYTVSYDDEYYGSSRSALNQDVAVLYPLRGDVEIGGSIGNFDVEGGAKITHWNFGVSKLFRRLAVDLRYYDGNYDRPGYLGDPDDNHYVVSLSYALRGKRSRAMR
jgi:uncharacterized protein (TIGR02001 family)